MVRLIGSVEELAGDNKIGCHSFCTIFEALGFKEIVEKEGAGSGKQQCCLRGDTKKRMTSRETKGQESCKEEEVFVQYCKKLIKMVEDPPMFNTSLKFSYNGVNPDRRGRRAEWE